MEQCATGKSYKSSHREAASQTSVKESTMYGSLEHYLFWLIIVQNSGRSNGRGSFFLWNHAVTAAQFCQSGLCVPTPTSLCLLQLLTPFHFKTPDPPSLTHSTLKSHLPLFSDTPSISLLSSFSFSPSIPFFYFYSTGLESGRWTNLSCCVPTNQKHISSANPPPPLHSLCLALTE